VSQIINENLVMEQHDQNPKATIDDTKCIQTLSAFLPNLEND
jgi:hypothetical protein